MGKGDKKSKRGKITIGSFGVRRRRRSIAKAVPAAAKSEKPAQTRKEKATVKPKAEVEEPLKAAVAEPAEKPARKKAPAKAKTAKNDESAE